MSLPLVLPMSSVPRGSELLYGVTTWKLMFTFGFLCVYHARGLLSFLNLDLCLSSSLWDFLAVPSNNFFCCCLLLGFKYTCITSYITSLSDY